MAATSPQTNNVLLKFRRETTREYIRGNWFSPYMGKGMENIIRTDFQELKSGGDQLNIPLVARAKAQAISTGTLVGNEEKVDDYGFRMWIDWARNAFKINDRDEHRSSIDLVAEFKPLLDNWGKELQRDEMCQGFFALPSEAAPAGLGTQYGNRVNGIAFDAATAAQRNTWITDNADRILVGDALANLVAGNFASSMNNITTAMRVSYANLIKLKRLAMKANPRIYPYKSNQTQGREWFVVFMGQEAFRDAENDATIIAADKDARAREGSGIDKNPLFQGGDLLIRGMILRQIPELSIQLPTFYTTAGAGGIRIAPVFLCGQSAAALLYGEMPKHTFLNENDYGFYRGTGIQMAYGLGKIAKKTPAGLLKEWAVATGFFYAPSDT
jgi:hypothetical protein